MRILILILFFMTSCAQKNVTTKLDNINFNNLFELSVNQYNELLDRYNKIEGYPNIDK